MAGKDEALATRAREEVEGEKKKAIRKVKIQLESPQKQKTKIKTCKNTEVV